MYAGARADELQRLGFASLSALSQALESEQEWVTRFATAWLTTTRPIKHDMAEDEDAMEQMVEESETSETTEEERPYDEGGRALSHGIALFYLYIHLGLTRNDGRIDAEFEHWVERAPNYIEVHSATKP